MNNPYLNVVLVVLLVSGAGMSALGGMLLVNTRDFLARAEKTTGEVTGLVARQGKNGVMHYPAISFTDSRGTQHEFVSHTGTNPPQYSRGDRVTVLYDVTQPEGEFQLESFFEQWGIGLIVGGLGLLDFLAGVCMGLYLWHRRRVERRVRERGIMVNADIGDCRQNLRVSINKKHPWRIHARYRNPADGREHEFVSKNFLHDPRAFLAEKGLTQIQVLVDPDNMKHYLVDTDSLGLKE